MFEAREQRRLCFQKGAFEIGHVIGLGVVVCHPLGPSLWAELPNVVETTVDKREHVLQTSWIGHRPLVAAREINRRGMCEYAACPGIVVWNRFVVRAGDAGAQPAIA